MPRARSPNRDKAFELWKESGKSLASYKGKPVILTHEAGLVDVDNVQQEHIGTILSEGIQDGDNVRAQIVIHDAESLDYGLRELSLGYTQTPDETPGVWNGQPYDAIQRNIQINHLALVEKARAGEQARLNIDGEEQGGNQMSKARKDGLTPEEIARLVEEYKQRQAQRMENTNPTADEGTNPDEQTTDEDEADPVKEVKDRRDRRDASGDCETMDEASGVIAQQDEDIQKLLDFIAQLQAKIDFDEASAEEEVKTDGEGENAEANVILPVPQKRRQRLLPIWERTSLSERQFGQAIIPASKRQSTWSIPAEEKLCLPPFRPLRSLRGKCY